MLITYKINCGLSFAPSIFWCFSLLIAINPRFWLDARFDGFWLICLFKYVFVYLDLLNGNDLV